MSESVYALTYQARELHERLLQVSLGHEQTAGTCFYASVLLATSLRRFSDCTAVTLRGGDGCGDGGYQDAQGAWHGHYWVEAETAAGTLVLDVTADQFGGPPVTILLRSEAVHYVPGNQATTDDQVANALAEIELDQALATMGLPGSEQANRH